jgi:hypothetical protein
VLHQDTRQSLEAACAQASATRYDFDRMMDALKAGLRDLIG